MTIADRARSYFARVVPRAYRFEGEKEAHEDQLRETEVSLSLMASATGEEQARMATDIEHGAEERLTVLLDKPRLSIAEKRERDAIQAALAARRQAFDAGPVLAPREGPTLPARFLGAAAGIQLWQVLAGVILVLLAGLGVQTARLESAKADLKETQRLATSNARAAAEWEERAELYEQALGDAREAARQAAADLERQRAIAARAARAEQRRQRDIQNVLANSPEPPAWSLRDPGTDPSQ